MVIKLNTSFIKTVPGILKLAEFVLDLILLFVARFGGHQDGHTTYIQPWGQLDATFTGIGCCVGYAIIIPSIILSYLLGAQPSILEFIINLIGSILFISSGAIALRYEGDSNLVAIRSLAIILGLLLLADFVYLCVNQYRRSVN